MSKETNARRVGMIVVIIGLVVVAWLLWGMAQADAAECATGTFDWTETTPQWDPVNESQGINVSVEGHFLWVQYRENPADEYDGTVSVELFGGEASAVVCPDGTVTFESRSIATPPGSEIGTAVTMVDLEERWGFDPTLDLRFGPR